MKKTKLLFAGLLASAMVISGGCSSEQSVKPKNKNKVPAPPQVEGCKEWEWDGEQWICDEGDLVKSNGGKPVYYYGGTTHTTSITSTSNYKSSSSKSSTSKSSSTTISSGSKSTTSGKSSGLGSGTRGGFSTGG